MGDDTGHKEVVLSGENITSAERVKHN